jgi:hypothetical protein
MLTGGEAHDCPAGTELILRWCRGAPRHRRRQRTGELAALSILKILGRPYLANASSSASMQKSASMLFDTRHYNQLTNLGVQPCQVRLRCCRRSFSFSPEYRRHPVQSLPLPAVDHRHVHTVLGCQFGDRLLALDRPSATRALNSAE